MSAHEEQLRIIRQNSQRLEPLPTGERAMLRRLSGIKAVLFDIYGTLFISASGDVGTTDATPDADTFCQALAAVGISTSAGDEGVRCLRDTIETVHREARQRGVDYPEVDIVAVWRVVLDTLRPKGLLAGSLETVDVPALALHYEVRANPVWPMPGAAECLTQLAESGLVLGLVSNGQWYTPLLFPALVGGAPEAFGVSENMQFYSYRYGRAKPSEHLFRQAAEALTVRGVRPDSVLYVGNDLLNDCLPAAATGFHTALFAGDARSLRRRQGDSRTLGLSPDLVLLNLLDLISCVSSEREKAEK